jgi:hypothetical protein
MTKSEMSYVAACDDLGAEVAVGPSVIVAAKNGNTNSQQRKVIQNLTAELAPQVAKAVVENLDAR